MQVTSSYNQATLAGQATAASITTAETTVLTVTDPKYTQKSQLSLYFDVDLSGGTITSAQFRVYFTYDSPSVAANSVVWYPVPIQNLSTGQLFDTPIIIDSNSHAYTTNKYREVYDLPMSGAQQFKVTAIGIGSSTAAATITAVVRDN
jgi:hypothetical protein